MASDANPGDDSTLLVLGRVMRPLIRFVLARRIPIQMVIDLLKRLYVDVSIEEFSLPEKRLTDSRLAVLTGLQRKDIKSIRATDEENSTRSVSVGPLPRLVAHWRGEANYRDKDGSPLVLQRAGPSPSFESLVGLISHDIHARTVLDDLVALGLVTVEEDRVKLIANAFVPRTDEAALFGYLANNLGDHATAAVTNVLAAPKTSPYFERAVHYNQLTQQSLNELDNLSRQLQQHTLEQIEARALDLQRQDKDCLLYTSPSPRDKRQSRMPSSA